VEFVPLPGYFANRPGAFDIEAAMELLASRG
jgi:hypothetical protein